jgi:glutamine amidotransferase
MIAVIKNTGGTNINSLCFAIERLGQRYNVTSDPRIIAAADKVILPGVGAASHAMETLKQDNMILLLKSLTQPVLGICLGMQLLFRGSEEGNCDCLDIIPASVNKLKRTAAEIRIPHMGWNSLVDFDEDYQLCRGLPKNPYMYYVHSFAAESGPWVKAWSKYGQPIPAVVQHRNFFGCQFHPEKSSYSGEIILRNFLTMTEIP